VAIFRREPPNGGVECRWSIGINRDSGLIAGYRRLLDVRSTKNISDDEPEYMTQSATHHWLSIDCWTCELRSDENSYRRPCSVDRTIGDAPANICDGLQHGRIRRREENRKEFNCTHWYIWSKQASLFAQLINKDIISMNNVQGQAARKAYKAQHCWPPCKKNLTKKQINKHIHVHSAGIQID